MNAQEIHGRYRGDYLIGTLTGSAAIWLESLGDLQGFSYEELKAKLLDHYKEEAASAVWKLERLEYTGGNLQDFNEKFLEMSAAALPEMGETMVKKQYVKQLKPDELGRHILAFMTELPLQKLMTKALALAPTFKKASNSGGNTQGG